MPGWRDLNVKALTKDAAEKTDDALASQISSLTTFNDEEVKKLFPEKGDVAVFAELAQIVKSSDSKNKKIRQIAENGEKFTGVIVTLLGKFL